MANQTEKPNTLIRRPNKDTVEQLRAEASRNPVFNAVCVLFAARERARSQVTLSTLMLSMKKEKFNYTQVQYEQVLKFLSSIGLGKLDYTTKNKLRALKEIKVTLQSVGLAATSPNEKLKAFHPANSYAQLPKELGEPERKVVEQPQQRPMQQRTYNNPLTIIVAIDGRPVSFTIPRDIAAKDLVSIIATITSASPKKMDH